MSDRLLVGTRKGLFRFQRKGGWHIDGIDFLSTPISQVLSDPRDGSVLAALNHGHFGIKMQKSPDGVGEWRELPAPVYPKQPEGEEQERDPNQRVIPWSLKDVWALAAGSADQPGRVWCGTIPGGLFRSDDGGESWQMVRSLWDREERKLWFGGGTDFPVIHSICIDPRDSKRVLLGVSCGGVWLSEDDGENWEQRAHGMWASYMPPEKAKDPEIQDTHLVVQCAAQPDCYWAQHHNGIFKSVDGAKSWQEVEQAGPSTFGFAVAVHPEDANTAWFVPATKDEVRVPVKGKVVVTRTRDGGESFDVLDHGLPQDHAYDLVLRHGLAIDSSGERLAFGSTTGSLWITEDQGDHWQQLSAHLPPIYCVEFG